MDMTSDREERREQRKILQKTFKHYLPIHHDAFVAEYNRLIETDRLNEYMRARGIKK